MNFIKVRFIRILELRRDASPLIQFTLINFLIALIASREHSKIYRQFSSPNEETTSAADSDHSKNRATSKCDRITVH